MLKIHANQLQNYSTLLGFFQSVRSKGRIRMKGFEFDGKKISYISLRDLLNKLEEVGAVETTTKNVIYAGRDITHTRFTFYRVDWKEWRKNTNADYIPVLYWR